MKNRYPVVIQPAPEGHLGVQGIKNAVLKPNLIFLKSNKVTRLFKVTHNISCVSAVIICNRTYYKHRFSRIKAHGMQNKIDHIAMIIVILP